MQKGTAQDFLPIYLLESASNEFSFNIIYIQSLVHLILFHYTKPTFRENFNMHAFLKNDARRILLLKCILV